MKTSWKMRGRMGLLAALLFGSLCAAAPSRADEYIAPTLPDLLRTLIRFGAIDITDNDVIDEYAMTFECKVFARYYEDEFKWRDVRPALRESIRQNVAEWPTSYKYDTKFQLDRYDFKDKMYHIIGDPTRHHVNVFLVYEKDSLPVCGGYKVKILPSSFRLILEESVYFPGIPLSEADAQLLLQHMKEANNPERFVYARFNIRVNQVPKMFRTKNEPQGKKGPASGTTGRTRAYERAS